MGASVSRREFLASDEAALIREALEKMTTDPNYNTKSTYTALSEDSLTFIDKHMKYMGDHPKLNPQHYLSNLRLKARLRP